MHLFAKVIMDKEIHHRGCFLQFLLFAIIFSRDLQEAKQQSAGVEFPPMSPSSDFSPLPLLSSSFCFNLLPYFWVWQKWEKKGKEKHGLGLLEYAQHCLTLFSPIQPKHHLLLQEGSGLLIVFLLNLKIYE